MFQEAAGCAGPVQNKMDNDITGRLIAKALHLPARSPALRDALHLADRAYVLQTGTIVQEGTGADLLKNDMIRKAYLGM